MADEKNVELPGKPERPVETPKGPQQAWNEAGRELSGDTPLREQSGDERLKALTEG